MNNIHKLTDAALLESTFLHVKRSNALDAELLVLLGEVDARRLYLERAFPSMFAFCMKELGFSEDVACHRIAVARLARRIPRVLDFVRDGSIHLTGLHRLDEVLTEQNAEDVLAEAAGKSIRELEQLVARLAPRPPVPTSIRKLPERATVAVEAVPASTSAATEAPRVEEPALEAGSAFAAPAAERKPVVKPLSAEDYKVTFTADAALKAKLEKAEELMRHRVGPGNLVGVIDRALDLLIEEVMKERFGVGRKPRNTVANAEQQEVVTRHIPVAIQRAVQERDGNQCTYVSPDGRRCEERGGLEFEHRSGFALTGQHTLDDITLHCRAHNQHAADKLYGRAFMDAKRRGTRIDTGEQAALL
jgi:hypothetical protein